MLWMLHIGRAGHLGPGERYFTPGQLSVEFVNVDDWITYGDLAMDSSAQFLAVAEHRLIPSIARSIGHLLRKAGHQSVWATACQDRVAVAWSGRVALLLPYLPLLPLSFRNSLGWVERYESLTKLVMGKCHLWVSGSGGGF